MLYNLLIIYLKNDLLRSESCPQAKMLQIESITFEKKASEEPFFWDLVIHALAFSQFAFSPAPPICGSISETINPQL